MGVARREALIHEVNVEENQAGGHAVDVEMVDTGVEREVVSVLDDAEGEAIPLECLRRRRQRVRTYLCGAHIPELHRNKIDDFWVVDGAPDNDRHSRIRTSCGRCRDDGHAH